MLKNKILLLAVLACLTANSCWAPKTAAEIAAEQEAYSKIASWMANSRKFTSAKIAEDFRQLDDMVKQQVLILASNPDQKYKLSRKRNSVSAMIDAPRILFGLLTVVNPVAAQKYAKEGTAVLSKEDRRRIFTIEADKIKTRLAGPARPPIIDGYDTILSGDLSPVFRGAMIRADAAAAAKKAAEEARRLTTSSTRPPSATSSPRSPVSVGSSGSGTSRGLGLTTSSRSAGTPTPPPSPRAVNRLPSSPRGGGSW